MNQIEAEVIPENAITLRPSMAVGHALGVDEIVAQVKLIQDVMHRVMKDGEHYGTIPGCGNKKTLLQPGAQKLTMTFRLAPEYEIQEVNLERGHKEYRVICTLKSMGNSSFVGQGVGCCSSMESKYRWRGGSRKCPECGRETIIKGKAEYGGGWLCFGKKGGCGFKWPDGAPEIESQNIEKVENDNPADTFNTVLKMAKKRAFVDATITATAASDIFTQDVADPEDDNGQDLPTSPPSSTQKPPQSTQTHHNPPSTQSKSPKQATTIAGKGKEATETTRKWMIEQLAPMEQPALQYFIDSGVILPTENLQDVGLQHVPTSRGALNRLKAAIQKFKETGIAEKVPKTVMPSEPPTLSPDLADPEDDGRDPVEVPRDANCDPNSPDAPWRSYPVPFGKHAGTLLSKLDKNVLYGFWANFEVETEYNGRPKKPETIAKDQAFRTYLDEAGIHYEFTKKD